LENLDPHKQAEDDVTESEYRGMFDTVILDEATNIKNRAKTFFKSVSMLNAGFHAMASGTPDINRPSDFMAYLDLAEPDDVKYNPMNFKGPIEELVARVEGWDYDNDMVVSTSVFKKLLKNGLLEPWIAEVWRNRALPRFELKRQAGDIIHRSDEFGGDIVIQSGLPCPVVQTIDLTMDEHTYTGYVEIHKQYGSCIKKSPAMKSKKGG
jgi:hypothetical protein